MPGRLVVAASFQKASNRPKPRTKAVGHLLVWDFSFLLLVPSPRQVVCTCGAFRTPGACPWLGRRFLKAGQTNPHPSRRKLKLPRANYYGGLKSSQHQQEFCQTPTGLGSTQRKAEVVGLLSMRFLSTLQKDRRRACSLDACSPRYPGRPQSTLNQQTCKHPGRNRKLYTKAGPQNFQHSLFEWCIFKHQLVWSI